jgi:(E)-4-hydroxy-3-methylbut-2-enyl-diphosphate synthase
MEKSYNSDRHGENHYHHRRLPTRVVQIGAISMGGAHPIRIQSMVNTSPEDLEATAAQIAALDGAGCELVRLAVPSVRDAEKLSALRVMLNERGVAVPLVADVHFNPAIAEICAIHMEKVRINPGNYRTVGKPVPQIWDAIAWRQELDDTDLLLQRLIRICRKHHTVLRIGSNHGSLSPRIMNRYGDTPEGMVEAALEFVRILHSHDFHDIVLSMKSSNVRVMVQACRLLADRMEEEGFDYPIHLGVTEAGFAEEGRIKSAAGIGLLLDEGIGDTVRVSLTEDPVKEIPVARIIRDRLHKLTTLTKGGTMDYPLPFQRYAYSRRVTQEVCGIGGDQTVAVIGNTLPDARYKPEFTLDKRDGTEVFVSDSNQCTEIPLVNRDDYARNRESFAAPVAVTLTGEPDQFTAELLLAAQAIWVVLPIPMFAHPGYLRRWIGWLEHHEINWPVMIKIECGDASPEEVQINAAIAASAAFTDGLADGLWISATHVNDNTYLALMILQATRSRIFATEYISCPSCGRTKFNIEEVVHRIKARTGHLTGLKIGVMGCIVNGPGEMADADYGYVGAGKGSITLYRGNVPVQRGIPETDALEALVEIIKQDKKWIDPTNR